MQDFHRPARDGEHYILGPSGEALSLRDLPPAGTRRWVVRRKAQVVLAVSGGLLSLEAALARYQLTPEEFGYWDRAYARGGLGALRTTRIQEERADVL